jgi:hypothetical protein
MDWQFASGCSPPRLSTTQLPPATDSQCSVRRGLSPLCSYALSGARHNLLRGWGRARFPRVASEGNLSPLSFLATSTSPGRLAGLVCRTDQKTCRRIGQTPDRPQMRAARPAFSCNESSHHRDEVSTLRMKKRAFVPHSDPLARFGGEAGFRRNLLRTRYIEHADPSAIDSGTRNANPSFN